MSTVIEKVVGGQGVFISRAMYIDDCRSWRMCLISRGRSYRRDREPRQRQTDAWRSSGFAPDRQGNEAFVYMDHVCSSRMPRAGDAELVSP